MAQKEVPAARSTGQKLSELHEAIRKEFPRVDADANGRRRIFFENAAGSLVLQRVVEAEARARLDYSANVDGPYWESKMNEEIILGGRKAVRDFLNAPSEDCIISGESATSIFFNLSYALSKEMSGTENIVLTEYEHYANVSPWLELEQRGVVKEVRFAKFNPNDGQLDISQLLRPQRNRAHTGLGIRSSSGPIVSSVRILVAHNLPRLDDTSARHRVQPSGRWTQRDDQPWIAAK